MKGGVVPIIGLVVWSPSLVWSCSVPKRKEGREKREERREKREEKREERTEKREERLNR